MIKSLILFFFGVLSCSSCKLSGKEIGECSNNPLTADNFCTQELGNYICLPAHNVTWSQYDADYADRLIQKLVLENLQNQIISEYLSGGGLQISNNPSCYEAYKKFSCQWNFPSCSMTTNTSQQMCQSTCDTFQTACGGSTDVCSIIYAKTDLGLDQEC